MFRPVARVKQVIPEETCIDILKREKRGVMSLLGDDNYPYGIPMNHFYREEDGCLYFHGAGKGHRIDAMRKHDKASFCVFGDGVRDENHPQPWALHFQSVIVFGRLEEVNDHDLAIELSRELCYKFTNDEDYIAYEIRYSGPGVHCIRMRPEHITGKTVVER